MVDKRNAHHYIEVEGSTLTHRVPVYRFGSGSPRVLITAGLHGGEVTGQYAALGLIDRLSRLEGDPAGEVTILPRCNPSAFRRMQRTSPFDELDMNRIFPGEEDGSPTLALASEIFEMARDMDYIVDLHCAGPYSSPYTLAQYREYDNCRDLAGMLDIPVIVQSGGSEGQLFVEAAREGIPSVIIELPGGGPDGIIDLAAGEDTVGALCRMLTLLGIAPGEADAPDPVLLDELERITAPREGLYLPGYAAGEEIPAGEGVGTLDGDPILPGETGYCIMNRPPGYVFPGTRLAAVAPRAESI